MSNEELKVKNNNLEMYRVYSEIIGKYNKNKIHYISSCTPVKLEDPLKKLNKYRVVNIMLSSNKKHFSKPLIIKKNNFYFIPPKKNLDYTKNKKILALSNTSLYIGGGQCLQGIRLHLGGTLTSNDNKTNKNESLSSTILTETDYIKKFNERWKTLLQINKVSKLIFKSTYDKADFNKICNEKIIKEFTSEQSLNNNINEYCVLLKEFEGNVYNNIFKATSNKELENEIKNFNDKSINDIKKANERKERQKPSSKFASQNVHKYFMPLFVLNRTHLNNILKSIEDEEEDENRQKVINNLIATRISLNILSDEKLNTQKEIAINKPNNELQNVEAFSFLINTTKPQSSKNIKNIIPLNIKDKEFLDKNKYINQAVDEFNETLGALVSPKETNDFGQTTPINLLQDKYFLYIVSKWIKYSFPEQQKSFQYFNIYDSNKNVVNNENNTNQNIYINDVNKFKLDSLYITNFTLWVEKHKKKSESPPKRNTFSENIFTKKTGNNKSPIALTEQNKTYNNKIRQEKSNSKITKNKKEETNNKFNIEKNIILKELEKKKKNLLNLTKKNSSEIKDKTKNIK